MCTIYMYSERYINTGISANAELYISCLHFCITLQHMKCKAHYRNLNTQDSLKILNSNDSIIKYVHKLNPSMYLIS